MKTWNPHDYARCSRCATLRPAPMLVSGVCRDDFCARVKEAAEAHQKEAAPASAPSRPKRKLLIVDVQEDASSG